MHSLRRNLKNLAYKLRLLATRRLQITIFILFPILIISAICFALISYKLNKITITVIPKTDEELGIGTIIDDAPDMPKVVMDEDIVNIALLGNDRRTQEEVGRSDAIMILTIDKKNRKIKLSSIMRDTYVTYNGSRKDKITNMFMRGGAQLTIKTINENFALDIRDYVLVDFFSLEKIIDFLGGLTMEIRKEEIPDLNFYIQEVADLEGVAAPLFTAAGPQLLNGMQAVSYARIRHTGNGDYERTERQRRVLSAIFEKVKSEGPLKYPGLVSQILPYTETSMDKSTLFKLGAQIFYASISTLEQQRFPLDGASQGVTINGGWYLWTDLKATAKHIHTFIYDDKVPQVLPGDRIEQPPQPILTPKVEAKPELLLKQAPSPKVEPLPQSQPGQPPQSTVAPNSDPAVQPTTIVPASHPIVQSSMTDKIEEQSKSGAGSSGNSTLSENKLPVEAVKLPVPPFQPQKTLDSKIPDDSSANNETVTKKEQGQ
jgi:LCP family protein required for cell wall assembly